MKFIFADRNLELVEAWKYHFIKHNNTDNQFEFYHTDNVFTFKTDCIVSPANSFGFMNGGFDQVLTDYFGIEMQEFFQEVIKNPVYNHNGELLVGQAILSAPFPKDVRYCICAPTMRVPQDISKTMNVYLATAAVFKVLDAMVRYSGHRSDIKSVLIPGMGTGIGKVSPRSCAMQMEQAYKDFWLKELEFPKTLTEAAFYNMELMSCQ